MSLNIPSEQNRAVLVRKVGAPMFFRGEQYAKKDMVLEHHMKSDSPTVEGVVRGSGGVTYRTSVYLTDGPSGFVFDMGVCTCPVALNCKHAVALLLVTIDNTLPSAPTPLRTWQAVLNMALPAAVEAPQVPLGIQLASNRDAHTGVSGWPLTARIVRPGKTGWVNDNLAWSTVRNANMDATPEHLLLLTELFALYESGARANSRYGYGYGAIKDIDLTLIDSARLWLLLEEAHALGIELVHQTKRLGALSRPTTANFTVDVVHADDTDALSIYPRIMFDGHRVTADEVGYIGEPSHGLFTVDSMTGEITLARLDSPIPRALRSLLVDREPLTIPSEDQDQFSDVYLPRLQRAATVVSSNESFQPPAISGPTLQLVASYADAHRLDLRWQWSYAVGREHRHSALDSMDIAHYRNLSLERQIIDRLDVPFEKYGLRHSPHTALRPFVSLTGMDTMRVSTELIPLLRTLEDVEVVVDGSAADYREAGDTMRIGVSTTSSKRNTDWFDLGISITVDGQDVPLPEILAAIAKGETHLLLTSGAYISLDKPELQALRHLVEEARALQDKDEEHDGLRISRFQAGLWEELAGLGVVENQAASWQRQVQGLLDLESVASAEAPASLQAELRPYQLTGYQWLAFLWTHQLGGILADDMGLGKTVQTLAMICHAMERDPGLPPFLILAPTSVVPNWADEVAKFAPHLKVVTITETRRKSGQDLAQTIAGADIVISSYTLFRLDFDSYDELEWSSLILDEAQFAKNHQSKLYQCARLFRTPFKLAITGTPMENNLMELWALLSLVAPGLFPSPKRFTEYYRVPIEKGGDSELLAQLRQRIRPLVLRRTKEQVVSDLPEKWEQVLEVDLHPRHRELYDTQLKREQQKILGLIDDMDKNRFTILRSLTILRQLCLDASLVDQEHEGMPSAKIDALVEHLHDVVEGDHRALVFSQFTSFLGRVRERLDEEGIEHCYLDGSTRDRAAVLSAFKTGQAPVFLISLKSGGFGLNLTEADYCFIMDPWWNPATEAQAIDRTHRIGQTRNVMVYRLIARNTIEDKVMALKARKFELFSSVLDDGGTLSSSINADDIRELLA
ncbi:DEAD/DEAH box helicase [Tomitella biformata]|uniref:DEAD/DEAH box helicase n=1 Tax=Tomitella biformata TaxID=630403 RepID=UPI0004664D37|nr:SNF2-related protein [Tomitella biformata]